MSDYSTEFIAQYFGTVELLGPSQFIAGTYNTFQIRITIGRYGIDDGGHIKFAWPVSNAFGIPQFEYSDEDNYTKVITRDDVQVHAQFDHNGYIRPFMPCVTIKIHNGALADGDTVDINLGVKTAGSKGLKTQTYVENNIEFKILLDPFGTNDYLRLPDSPLIDILPDRPASIKVINQSQYLSGKEGWVQLRSDDIHGNLATSYSGTIVLNLQGSKVGQYELTARDKGSKRIDNLVFHESGNFRLTAIDEEHSFTTHGNPFEVLENKSSLNLYWGDLHGQTGETVGSGTIDEYLEFGKNVAAIDFISHDLSCTYIQNNPV